MIRVENYPNAYKEVYVILQNLSKSDFELIPKSFINMLKNNMNQEYDFELNNDFESQELLQETKTILAYVYLNYLGTEKEKVKIEEKFKNDILKKEEEKKLQYNLNDLFEKKKLEDNSKGLSKKEETKMVEHKNEKFFIKLIKKIIKLFRRN